VIAGIRPVDVSALDDSVLDLRRELDALPPRMRAVVCLHYLAGLTTAEVAAALGVESGTVKSTLHAARRRLRVALEGAR
jgi:RNA polymerase sigma-70 factor (ECF subfamily)